MAGAIVFTFNPDDGEPHDVVLRYFDSAVLSDLHAASSGVMDPQAVLNLTYWLEKDPVTAQGRIGIFRAGRISYVRVLD